MFVAASEDRPSALIVVAPDRSTGSLHAAELLETTAERIAAAWLRDRPERTP